MSIGPSTITATTANIGSNTTMTITRGSGSFTHTVKWSCGTKSGTIVTKTTKTTLTWKVPDSIYEVIPTKTSTSVKLTCITYNGSTTIGTTTTTFTAKTVKANCSPLVDLKYYDTNDNARSVTEWEDRFIKYASNINFFGSAESRKSAKIKSITYTLGSKTVTKSYSQSKVNLDETINGMETALIKVKVIDSREYETEVKYDTSGMPYIDLLNYQHISISLSLTKPVIDVGGISATGTYSITGTFYNSRFISAIAPTINKPNTLTLQVKTSLNNTWQTIVATINGNNFSYTGSYTVPNYKDVFKVQAKAFDLLETKTTAQKTAAALTTFDWGKDDFNFNVPVNFKNSPLFYVPGNTITISQLMSWSGFTSHSNERLYFTIPTLKPIMASGVTVSGTITARGINGYLVSSDGISTSSYTWSSVITPCGVNVVVDFGASIPNVSNNTPVSVLPESGFTITFS